MNATLHFSFSSSHSPLLYFPKINLVSFGGRETAGVRVDDLILFVFILLFGWCHFLLRKRLQDTEKWLFATVGFSLLSFLLNKFFYSIGWIHVTGNLLYALRMLEYFSFFYIGILAVGFISPSKYIKAFIIWNGIIILLQKGGLIGEFGMYGYNPSATYRSPGICSFPSEAGALLNMLFCYLIFQKETPSKTVPFWPPIVRQFFSYIHLYLYFIIFALLTVITGSRIAIAALLIVFLYCVWKKMSWRTPWTIALTFIILIGGGGLVAYFIMENQELIDRSKGFFRLIIWSFFLNVE